MSGFGAAWVKPFARNQGPDQACAGLKSWWAMGHGPFFNNRNAWPKPYPAVGLCFPGPIPRFWVRLGSGFPCPGLHGIDHRPRIHLRVEALAVIWSLCLSRNDNVFNNKKTSPLQFIYMCTNTFYLCSSLQHVKDEDLFIEVCKFSEDTTSDTFS